MQSNIRIGRLQCVCLLVFVVMVVTAGSSSAAVTLFSEDFNADNGGVAATNYIGFGNFNVIAGTVDLIGNGFADFFPGNGLYVDLDGTSLNGGSLESRFSFVLEAGRSYQLKFDLGNPDQQFGGGSTDNTMLVSLGTGYMESFSRSGLTPFATITRTIVPLADETATILFAQQGGDNLGLLIDNVSLSLVPVPSMLIPFALLGAGLLRQQTSKGRRA